MKRIAINALSARRGGGSTYLWNLFRNLPKNFNCELYLFISPSKKIEFLKNIKNINIIFIPEKGPIYRVFWENTFFLYFIIKFKINIVFCPGGMLPFVPIKRVVLITMFRNMIPFDKKELKKYSFGLNYIRNKLLSFLLLNSMKRADKLIFISNFGKRFINKITKNTILNSIVIPHGVSDKFISMDSKSVNIKNIQGEYILYPSTVDFYKNQIEVVKAYQMLLKTNKDIPKLLLVGNINEPYGNKLKIFIKKQELDKNVIVTGGVDFNQMPILYKKAKLIIFASRSENCPNILMEAMVFGNAILCSRKYPMPEFGKKSVCYIDANNPKEIYEKLLFLLKNNKYRKSLELKAKETSLSYQAKISAVKTWDFLLNQ